MLIKSQEILIRNLQDNIKRLKQSLSFKNTEPPVTDGEIIVMNSNAVSVDQNMNVNEHLSTSKFKACDSHNSTKSIINEHINKEDAYLKTCAGTPYNSNYICENTLTQRGENFSNESNSEVKYQKKRNKQVINIRQVNNDTNLINDDYSNQNTTGNASTSKQTPSASCFNIFNNSKPSSSPVNINCNLVKNILLKPGKIFYTEQADSALNLHVSTKSNCVQIKPTKSDNEIKIKENSKVIVYPGGSSEANKYYKSTTSKGVESRKIFPLKKFK